MLTIVIVSFLIAFTAAVAYVGILDHMELRKKASDG